MKLIFLVFNSPLEPEIRDLLKSTEVTHYTRWEKVKGVGQTGPHFDDEVWPSVNVALMFSAEDDKKESIAQGVRQIRQEFPREGIRMLVLPLEEIV
jgi:meiotically up-regulated gene 157 (Mug157) protein